MGEKATEANKFSKFHEDDKDYVKVEFWAWGGSKNI